MSRKTAINYSKQAAELLNPELTPADRALVLAGLAGLAGLEVAALFESAFRPQITASNTPPKRPARPPELRPLTGKQDR